MQDACAAVEQGWKLINNDVSPQNCMQNSITIKQHVESLIKVGLPVHNNIDTLVDESSQDDIPIITSDDKDQVAYHRDLMKIVNKINTEVESYNTANKNKTFVPNKFHDPSNILQNLLKLKFYMLPTFSNVGNKKKSRQPSNSVVENWNKKLDNLIDKNTRSPPDIVSVVEKLEDSIKKRQNVLMNEQIAAATFRQTNTRKSSRIAIHLNNTLGHIESESDHNKKESNEKKKSPKPSTSKDENPDETNKFASEEIWSKKSQQSNSQTSVQRIGNKTLENVLTLQQVRLVLFPATLIL